MSHGRPVKEAAGKWQMESVQWMFDGSTEVDADIQVMSGPSDRGAFHATGMPSPSWQLFVIQVKGLGFRI